MSQPDSRQTLTLVAGELGAIGQRLTELSAMVQAQTAEPRSSEVNAPAATGGAEPEAAPPEAAAPPEVGTDAEGTTSEAAAGTPAREPSAQERAEPARPSAFDGREPLFRWDRRRGSATRWEPSRVLAWVGSAVTLLGVVFLLVLAVQRG